MNKPPDVIDFAAEIEAHCGTDASENVKTQYGLVLWKWHNHALMVQAERDEAERRLWEWQAKLNRDREVTG